MKQFLNFLAVFLLFLSFGASLQSCESKPKVVQRPQFNPNTQVQSRVQETENGDLVDSSEYYRQQQAYYAQQNQLQQQQNYSQGGQQQGGGGMSVGEAIMLHQVLNGAGNYNSSRSYYDDPRSAYNDSHSPAYHRSYNDEREYETGRHSGPGVGTAVAAGAVGVAAGAAAGYYMGKKANAPTVTPSITGKTTLNAPSRFSNATLVKPAPGVSPASIATTTPKLLTPVPARTFAPSVAPSVAPSRPVFTAPKASVSAPRTTFSAPRPSISNPSRSRSFSPSRSTSFSSSRKRR